MSFNKAIKHGKTRRKPYTYYHVRNHDGRRFMWPGRNNLICQCAWCGHWTVRGRKAKTKRLNQAADDILFEYLNSLKTKTPTGKHRLSKRERERKMAELRWRSAGC